MLEARDRVYKPEGYQPQGDITLANLDLMPIRDEAVVRYAHFVLAGNPSHREAKKLVGQHDSNQPLKDSLVRKLLATRHVEGMWATFPVRNGKLETTAEITVENPVRRVITFKAKVTKSPGRVDPT